MQKLDITELSLSFNSRLVNPSLSHWLEYLVNFDLVIEV